MKAASTKRMVVDASVAVAWCFEDESTPFTEAVLEALTRGTEGAAPALWPFEVANALLVAERRKRLSMGQTSALLQRLSALPIRVEASHPVLAFEKVLPLARQLGLTEYDAAYADLALREALPLATLDEKVREAARFAGIQLFTI